MNALSIDLQMACEASDAPGQATLQQWADVVATSTRAQGDVCLRLVSDQEIHALNQQFRQQDKVTNVLSFPGTTQATTQSLAPLSAAADRQDIEDSAALNHLGDIAICCAQVEREALAQGKSLSAHYAHMLVHGVLHLLGYDHIDDADADAMEALEIQILAALNFGDPYKTDRINGRADDHSKPTINTSAT